MLMYDRTMVENAKKRYQPGMRVELIEMDDPYSSLGPGDKGTIRFVDDIGTVHVAWDCGSSLGLVIGEDSFRIDV